MRSIATSGIISFLMLLTSFPLIGQSSKLDQTIRLDPGNRSIEVILKEIEQQTDLKFSYSSDLIPVQEVVLISSKVQSVAAVLDRIFEGLEVEYEVRGNLILLKKKEKEIVPVKFTVSGIVKEALTGEFLIGANVYIRELQIGVISNLYGFYSLTLPQSEYDINYSYIGFKPKPEKIKLNRNLTLDVHLEVDTSHLAEVVIIPEDEKDKNVTSTVMSAHRMEIKTFGKLPYLYGEVDVIRGIKFLPGVTSIGEGSVGFNVRGGGIDQNLILLDEAPLYNSSHYFGLVSVFNPSAIKSIQLYKGAIPVYYGGAVSSVLDVRQKEGNNKKFGGVGGISTVAARIMVEGPIVKEKASFLVAARTSLGDPTNISLPNTDFGELSAGFFDLNAKFNYTLNKKNKIYVSAYHGRDNQQFITNVENRWGNTAGTIRWNHIFSDRLFSNFTGVVSHYKYEIGNLEGASRDSWEADILNTNFRSDLTYFLNPRHRMDFGMNLLINKYEPGKFRPDSLGVGNGAFDLQQENSVEPALYFSDEFRVDRRFTLNYGLRYSFFYNVGEGQVFTYQTGEPMSPETIIDTLNYKNGETIKSYHGPEPRISATYLLTPSSSVKLSYNRLKQYNHLITNTTYSLLTDIWKLSGPHIKPMVGNQIIAGYFRNFQNNRFEASVEAYYKTTQNVLDYKDGADLLLNQTIETELLQGHERAYGVEFLIRKPEGRFAGWASYSLSRAERMISGPSPEETINQGNWYPANHDRTHVFKINGVIQINKLWSFSGYFIYSSGRAISLPDGQFEYEDFIIPTFPDRNQDRLPSNHRLDLSATKMNKKIKWKKRKQRYRIRKKVGSWTFSLYNVYARENAFSVLFQEAEGSTEPGLVTLPILGTIIPSVTYNFQF